MADRSKIAFHRQAPTGRRHILAGLGAGAATLGLLGAPALLRAQPRDLSNVLDAPLSDDAVFRRAIARANRYLNDMTTLTGRFQQISDQGFARGTFYIRRPGRLRFDYDPPAQIRFIVDGTWVGVDDMDLEVVNRYPLSATPLRLLLQDPIDLANDAQVALVEELPGQTHITLVEDEGLAQGELTLVFSEPDFELMQWIIVDAQGTATTIRLAEVEAGRDLSPQLFFIRDYDYDD